MPQAPEWIRVGAVMVDALLLESRLSARCHVEECRAACCGHGAYVDLAHASRIVEEAELIKPHLPPDRHDVADWFDAEVSQDSDFPSGYKVGTQVLPDFTHASGTRCVFLRPDNRCALQTASIAQGRHHWDLKPFYCALFPLIIEGNSVRLDDENGIYKIGGTCQRAIHEPTPLYVLFKEELILALGEEAYQQLVSIADSRSGGN